MQLIASFVSSVWNDTRNGEEGGREIIHVSSVEWYSKCYIQVAQINSYSKPEWEGYRGIAREQRQVEEVKNASGGYIISILIFPGNIINAHAHAAAGIGLRMIGGDAPIIALLSFGDNCTPAGVLGGDVRHPPVSEVSLTTVER